jgi:hypothetical protein
MILNLMIFSLIWSVGATTDYQGRLLLNEQLKISVSKKGLSLLSNYYDYYFNVTTK